MTTVDPRGIPLEDYMLDDRSSYVKLPTVSLPDGSEVLVGDEAWLAAMDVACRSDRASAHRGGRLPRRRRGSHRRSASARCCPTADVIDVEEAAAADP